MDTNIQEMLAQANPNLPDASDADAAKASSESGQAQTAANLLSSATASPDQASPNASIPTSNPGALTSPAPLSFSQKLAASMMKPANGQSLSFFPAIIKSGIEALAPKPPSQLDVALSPQWSSALSDKTTNQPAQTEQKPNRARAIVNNVFATLGDAAHATDNEGAGGAFGGLARTFAAGNERQIQAQKDKITMMTANAQMMHEQALVHKMGIDAMDENIKNSTAAMNNILNPGAGGVAGTPIVTGKTSEELQKMIKSKDPVTGKSALDPTTQTVFADGKIQNGTNTDGTPRYRMTYSVVQPAGDVHITPENIKFLNDQLHMNLSDGQVLPAVQFNHLIQQANNAQATSGQRKLDLLKNQLEVGKLEDTVESRKIEQDSRVTNALAANSSGPTDPYGMVKAYNALKLSGAFSGSNGINERAYRIWAGGGNPDAETNFKTMQDNFAKSQQKVKDTTLEMLDKFESDPKIVAGAIPEYEAAMTAIVNDKEQTPEVRARAAKALAIVKNVRANDLNFKNDEAAGKKKAEDMADMGDTDDLVKAAENYQLDPQKMFGIRSGQRAEFMTKLLKNDPDWKESTYKSRYETVQQFTPEGKAGQQVQSLNTFAGHAGDAESQIAGLKNSNVTLYNTAMNNLQEQLGEKKYGQMRTALEAVKDEYLNFLKNGSTPGQDELARADELVNTNLSPARIDGVLSQMARTIAIRGGALQHNYTNVMGKPKTDMLEPETTKILQSFGINTDKLNGIQSTTPNTQQAPDILQHPPKINGITPSGIAPGPGGQSYWYQLLPNGQHKVLGPVQPGTAGSQ